MKPIELEPNLEAIRKLPFVRSIRSRAGRTSGADGIIEVRTASGMFPFTVEVKKNYLERPFVGSLIGLNRDLMEDGEPPLLVLARYIPRPIGERLMEAGLNFTDRSGNINLRLGDQYQAILLGNRDHSGATRPRKLSPTAVQVLFVLLVAPDAFNWPVRELADAAGVGKTAAAELKQRLIDDHLITLLKAETYQLADPKALRERFLLGYSHVLRPHLLVGRFRGPYRTPDEFVDALQHVTSERKVRWALSGGAAAYELDRFYRGEDTVAFVSESDPELRKGLRLLPDKTGPITLLRSFGTLLYWPNPPVHPVVHPWLIYAELLEDGGPRTLEAAEEIRKKYLNK